MKHFTLHMVGNAHLDPVWLWRWQEGFQSAKATFRSALNLMNEFDDFVFTSSSAAFYEWIELNDPPMFAEIRARVGEGRWQIAGGWWIQPDCNLPSGESFVRQGLYGQRYFMAKLGVRATVGYNVDSFGHHAMLPQILRKSGMDAYIFTRPSPHEKGLPGRLFWWEADDGSRVLAYRIPFEYASWGQDLERNVRRCIGELKRPHDELMCFYGVGNHGGGPTRENLASIRRMQNEPDLPTLVFSTPEKFFASVRARDLPLATVHDELQHHASGCYAAHSGVKRWNRQAEHLLLAGEKFSAIAERVTGQPYPTDLGHAWKQVLFNQFHDILAGTSLEQAYEDARNSYGEAMAIGGRALNYATQSLAWNIGIPHAPGSTPIVVFNPHAWPSRVGVELDFGGLQPTDGLVDDEGQPVPMQLVHSGVIASGWRKRLAFTADLPPLGYRVYHLLADQAPHAVQPISAEDSALENERFRLEIDPSSGFVRRLYDKRRQFEVLRGPARPLVLRDESDTWSHGVYQFNEVIGAFTATAIRRVEHGPVKTTLRVESAFGASRLIQDYTMYPDRDIIEVRVVVDWREQWRLLKLAFPLNLHFFRATYEIPYGFIERPTNGEEEPGQSWIDISGLARGLDIPYGLSLLNDGKYSFDVGGHELRMTVLRSPIYAHHVPNLPDPGEHYPVMDQGVQQFTYALLPHDDSWEQAGTVRRALELNERPIAIVETYHAGPLPQRGSYLAIDRENIVASVVKRAEDNDDLIVRCYETQRVATSATMRLPAWGREFTADFAPCEIKTLRVPCDPNAAVVETDLLEWA